MKTPKYLRTTAKRLHDLLAHFLAQTPAEPDYANFCAFEVWSENRDNNYAERLLETAGVTDCEYLDMSEGQVVIEDHIMQLLMLASMIEAGDALDEMLPYVLVLEL